MTEENTKYLSGIEIAERKKPKNADKASEKDLERKLYNGIKKLGGLCYKFVSPNNRSVPDRIVILNGWITFVEVKTTGKKPTDLQAEKHQEIRKAGGEVYVIDRPSNLASFLKKAALLA